jgi:uncharacterized iron-regulated membrane protein
LKRALLRVHRALGLGLAVFWLLQAVTGSLLVFRWELEDALLAGSRARAEAAGLGARIADIARAGGRPLDMWASSQAATRFDIYYVDASGTSRVMRVDGKGRPLRDAVDAGFVGNGAFWDTLTLVHTGLLAGHAGRWAAAGSGAILLCNLGVGLAVAWPRAREWRRVLLGRTGGGARARLHAWHRRLGLWLGVVILPFVAAGVLLCFEDELRGLFDPGMPVPRAEAAVSHIAPTEALAIVAARQPDARLSVMIMPGDDEFWYRVRQHRPGDLPRNWGTSTLLVSAADGRILFDQPAADAPAMRAAIDALHPFHTGQAAGTTGRLLVL